MKPDLIHLLKIITVKIAYFYCYKINYPLFSMIAFGEGASSFMYSDANAVFYACVLLVPPTILNLIKIKTYRNTNKPKCINYLIAEVLLIVLTVHFVQYNY
ncbi:hypothetical protein NAT51_18100 [Flavobacterium amniphilum]|uniref:hypothetical protein n=1 Tax=Flavobacterium amniphilum TaxID=1834035 RepID=UPI00202A0103|nr:hypothetical protein [Flavobacterium amniphilum]MCL9807445.1 hypothetical protein [Flavobacterium amniphilum]